MSVPLEQIPNEIFKVDWEMLRGVPLHRALQRPRIWIQPERYRHSHRSEQLWSLSKASVERLDAFLSHSWRTSGASKLLALLLQNGWLYGLLGWLLMTALSLLLRLLDVMDAPLKVSFAGAGRQGDVYVSPYPLLLGFLGTLLGLVVSVYVPMKSQLCFLDIACVHQGDPELLRRGISNIGGCLSVSKELRVLYHPSYFTSLWCIFELAAFRKANPTYPIRVVPLFLYGAVASCWMWAQLFCYSCFWLANGVAETESVGNPSYTLIFGAGVFIPVCLIVHVCRRKYREKHQLLEDLKGFQLSKVSCVNEFDRSFICGAIDRWYGSQEAFVDVVRGPLREELLNMLPTPHLPLGHALFISTSASSFLGEGVAALHQVGKLDSDGAIGIFAWSSYILLGVPLGFNLLFYLSDRFASQNNCITSLGKTLAAGSIVALWNLLSVGLATISSWYGSLWLGMACFAFHLVLLVWVFQPGAKAVQ